MSNEAGDYVTLRLAAAASFATGDMVEVPAEARRRLAEAECRMLHTMCWKALVRRGKAHIYLCREALGGKGKMSDKNSKDADEHRKRAIEGEQSYEPLI